MTFSPVDWLDVNPADGEWVDISLWILATGFWRDEGFWIDNPAVWRDGPERPWLDDTAPQGEWQDATD